MLSPGISQVYYGDESARSLVIQGTVGDATLRSNMNWESIKANKQTQSTLTHWQLLGKFRRDHPAIGAGVHQMISNSPYVFSRVFKKNDFEDRLIIGLDLPKGKKEIDVSSIYTDGEILIDKYSNTEVEVKDGKATLKTEFNFVLLELK